MAYPIKYIENNLTSGIRTEGMVTYYELFLTNYSFSKSEQKILHDSFRQLIAQNRDGKIHTLQIGTESAYVLHKAFKMKSLASSKRLPMIKSTNRRTL